MSDRTYALGTKRHVFIDWALIEPGYGVAWQSKEAASWEMAQGVRLTAHYPRVDTEPLVRLDQPWEGSFTFYNTLLEDEGRYRLYYVCRSAGTKVGDTWASDATLLGYAESSDGVTWTKPRIGSVEFEGSTDNNLVFGFNVSGGRPAEGATVFKDPSGPSGERYKLVYRGLMNGGGVGLLGAVSSDGLRWEPLEKPILPNYYSDTHQAVTFLPDKGRYVGYFRGWTAYERDTIHGRRVITYAETDRFESWPTPRPLVAPDMHDTPGADIHNSAYTPWPGADAHLMFPSFDQRHTDVTEVHMMTSRDGPRWERPTRRPVIPSGEPGSDSEGGVYSGRGLAGLVAGEWSMPIILQEHSHNQSHHLRGTSAPLRKGTVCTTSWRRDGFVSLEAESEGSCTTVPITFSGGRLQVNAWARFGGEIRFELADASSDSISSPPGGPVGGRTFRDCDPVTGDVLDQTVSWRGDSDLSAWAGKPVRLRVYMRRARLYALQFV